MKTYLELLQQQQKIANFKLFSPPQQQPLHGAVRRKKTRSGVEKEGGGKDN